MPQCARACLLHTQGLPTHTRMCWAYRACVDGQPGRLHRLGAGRVLQEGVLAPSHWNARHPAVCTNGTDWRYTLAVRFGGTPERHSCTSCICAAG
eukprot:353516-Chlamydomonas_euryale.AAC.11